ncbi:MAG: hypothetical protein IJ857_06490 [Lachnospiraceae bacterium]|nr:hypothetical protein [Lachnospiraceae bacterium]
MSDRKIALLERLEAFFGNDEAVEEATIFTGEELGTPMDVLRVLVPDYGAGLLDILAEYSFLPVEGEEVLYFSSVLTLLINIPEGAVPALSIAISKLNFFLPYGNFCLSKDGTVLVFKTVTALRSDHDDEKLYEDIELSADTALLIPENYLYLLQQVADGTLLLKDFLETLPG